MHTSRSWESGFLWGATLQMPEAERQKRIAEFRGNLRPADDGKVSLERFKIIQRNAAGLPKRNRLQNFLPFADNELERSIIHLLAEIRPNLVDEYDDPARAFLVAVAYHVPVFCGAYLVQKHGEGKLEMPCLAAFGAYSVAFERVLLERWFRWVAKSPEARAVWFDVLRAIRKVSRSQKFNTKDGMFENEFSEGRLYEGGRLQNPLLFNRLYHLVESTLGLSVKTWFDRAPEPPEFWLGRFRQWHKYALRSVEYFFGKQSSDYRNSTGDLKAAALVGLFARLGYAPPDFCENLLVKLEIDDAGRAIFNKNRRKWKTNPDSLEFDTWLIEIWPLVETYGWNYADLRRVADDRFDGDKEPKWCDNTEALKKRCKRLGLRLGSAGRTKTGRPKHDSSDLRFDQIALRLNSIGGDRNEWFWGITEAGLR